MEANVARVRDFLRKRISGQRVWRIGVSVTADMIKVTLYSPDKPEKMTGDRDKGRGPVAVALQDEVKRAFGREAVIDVVQAPMAVAKYVRISPRKVRHVVDAIRNKPVLDALAILQFVPNAAAVTISKLIKSAVANAENNHRMNGDELEVIHIHVDEGPTLKRISPRAMGRAYRLMKRTSHITVGLAESEKEPRIARRSKAVARTVAKPTRRGAKAESGKTKRSTKETKAPAAKADETGEDKS